MKKEKHSSRVAFLVGTRWFGVLGPCKLLIDELRRQGYEVFVFGKKDNRYHQFNEGKVALIELNVARSYYSFLSDFLDIVKLMYFILLKSPEFVHSFNPKPSLLCHFSLLFLRSPKFLIGVTGLGNTFIKAKVLEGLVRKVMSSAVRRARFVFFQNNDDVALFVNELGLNREKVKKFTSPGVDVHRFMMRKEYFTAQPLRVLLVARLLWQKGVGDFAEAYRALEDLGIEKKYHFTLVGELDPDHPDRLSERDIDGIVASGIEWIPWTDSVEDVYLSHNVLLFMSLREGGPRAILEAAATGMPTIGSNCIGVKELIIDGKTGFSVNPGEIEEIITKLEFYRLNPSAIEAHGRFARKEIAERYSLENATRAQLEMYGLGK